MSRVLAEKHEEMLLAVEEQELQRMAVEKRLETVLGVSEMQVSRLEQELNDMRRIVDQRDATASANVGSGGLAPMVGVVTAGAGGAQSVVEEGVGRGTEVGGPVGEASVGSEERRQLEGRIRELIDRENQLNSELEQNKV